MSLFAQIVLGLVVAGGIGWGVWNHNQQQEARQQQAAAEIKLSAGTTNADLDADLKSIDGQLDAVSQTSAGVDESMSATQ